VTTATYYKNIGNAIKNPDEPYYMYEGASAEKIVINSLQFYIKQGINLNSNKTDLLQMCAISN